MKFGFDRYDTKARLAPAIITLLPLAITGFAWSSGGSIETADLAPLGVTGLITFSLATLMMQVARAAGKRREPKLFELWGGSPTLQLLRHRGDGLSPVTRTRYHQHLRERLRFARMPSIADEQQDPKAADAVYQSCVDHLITLTRDQSRYSLLSLETRNYGFHRNLWGLKPIGVPVSLVGLTASVLLLYLDWAPNGLVRGVPLIASVANAILLWLWIAVITPAWVRVPAFAYAKELLAACEQVVEPAGAIANTNLDNRRYHCDDH
jgi:hypothetical protein